MTRFARASKKTSLEATPWHELVNSGENEYKIHVFETPVTPFRNNSPVLICLARNPLFNNFADI